MRYANTGYISGMPITYGITANNNPSVQDPWNTTPAWSFPYAVSSVAPDPGVGTLIDGAFAAHVGGVGGYAWINNLVYLELSGYRTFGHDTQAKLMTDPFGAPGLFEGVAPYWRVAIEPHWGNHWLEFGAFGMSARVHPWTLMPDANGFYTSDTFPQTDRYSDIGFDSQYQYQGDNYWITLRGTYIHESQTLDATFTNGGSDNPTNTLNTFKALASLAYGNDNRIVITGQYFDTWGHLRTRLSMLATRAALLPRSPTSRSLAAKRQGGRGLMRASDFNTPTTTSSMETPSSLTITTRCSRTFGSRCSRMTSLIALERPRVGCFRNTGALRSV